MAIGEIVVRSQRGLFIRFGLFIGLVLVGLLMTGWNLHKSRTYQLFGEIIPRVETDERVVALTFDDGPSRHEYLLPLLRRYDAKATFFVVGRDLQQHMSIAREMIADGHELGNHSYSHSRMVLRTVGWVAEEVESTIEVEAIYGSRRDAPIAARGTPSLIRGSLG